METLGGRDGAMRLGFPPCIKSSWSLSFGESVTISSTVSSSSASGIASGMSTGAKEKGWGGGSIGVSCSKSRLGVASEAKSSFAGEEESRGGVEDGLYDDDVRPGEAGDAACGRFACRRSEVGSRRTY